MKSCLECKDGTSVSCIEYECSLKTNDTYEPMSESVGGDYMGFGEYTDPKSQKKNIKYMEDIFLNLVIKNFLVLKDFY